MSKTMRIGGGISLDDMIKQIGEYEPTERELAQLERAFRLGPPKDRTINPQKGNTHADIPTIQGVR